MYMFHRCFVALLVATAVVGLGTRAAPVNAQVAIPRMAQGVPHVTAQSYFDLGFRSAWAHAEDDLCGLAADALRVRGELAQFFGAGAEGANVDSDFFFTLLRRTGNVQRALASSQPSGEAVQVIGGFVAGYNTFVAVRGSSDPRCANEPWVRSITTEDAWALVQNYALWAGFFAGYQIYGGQPPAAGAAAVRSSAAAADALPQRVSQVAGTMRQTKPSHSNVIGFGRDGAMHGGGVLSYDPHVGSSEDLYASLIRLTIPGELDVIGHRARSLPGIVITGANADFAWGVTAGIGAPFAYYELQLAPNDPTKYLVDGARVAMERIPVTISVRTANGAQRSARRTFYQSRWGLIVNIPGLEWTQQTAFALHEFNYVQPTVRLLDYQLAMMRARSIAQSRAALRTYGGNLDGHTIAVDSAGQAQYFARPGIVFLGTPTLQGCVTELGAELIAFISQSVLDGSRSACQLVRRPNSYARGSVGIDDIPQTVSTSYLANANDSHWIVNSSTRLEGFGPLYDQYPSGEGRLLGARTKMALRFAEDRIAGRDGQSGLGASAATVSALHLASRDYTATTELDRLLARCQIVRSVTMPDGEVVDLTQACAVLARWDRRHSLDSRGAALWRLFFQNFPRYESDDPLDPAFAIGDAQYTVPFDASRPITTPRALRLSTLSFQALGTAVRAFRTAHLPLDARLRDAQKIMRGDRLFAQPGCPTSGPQHGCLAIGGELPNAAVDPVLVSDQEIFGTVAPLFAEVRGGTARVRYVVPFQSQNPATPYFLQGLQALQAGQFAEVVLRRP
jgi:acyl-homoserine-lactone acylase